MRKATRLRIHTRTKQLRVQLGHHLLDRNRSAVRRAIAATSIAGRALNEAATAQRCSKRRQQSAADGRRAHRHDNEYQRDGGKYEEDSVREEQRRGEVEYFCSSNGTIRKQFAINQTCPATANTHEKSTSEKIREYLASTFGSRPNAPATTRQTPSLRATARRRRDASRASFCGAVAAGSGRTRRNRPRSPPCAWRRARAPMRAAAGGRRRRESR
jgi:hypothetical protein